jgi:hypothetical protein
VLGAFASCEFLGASVRRSNAFLRKIREIYANGCPYSLSKKLRPPALLFAQLGKDDRNAE